MADVSRLVRLAIQARLSNATTGFNVNYANVQSSYAVDPIQIDWSDQSRNFCYGLLPADLAEQTSVFDYPLLTISLDSLAMDQSPVRVHYHQFSGTATARIQVILSWPDSGMRDFETWPDAVIDAMYQTVNNPAVGNPWSVGLVYNGNMNAQKGSILPAGENWRRQILFTLQFKVLVP